MSTTLPFELQDLTASVALSHTTLSANLTRTGQKNEPKKIANGVLTCFLDRSGSMSGEPFENAKKALSLAISQVFKSFHHIYVIAFDGDVATYQLSGKSVKKAEETINNITIGGGTNFAPCFKFLQRLTGRHSNEDHIIVFLTDGCDMGELRKPAKRNEAISSLKSNLQNKTKSCIFHSIGFSSSHDAAMLTSLSSAGCKNGTFIYVETSQHIQNAVDEVFKVTNRASLNAALTLYDAHENQMDAIPNLLQFESEDDIHYSAAILLPVGLMPASAKLICEGFSYISAIKFEEDKWILLEEREVDNPELSLQYAKDIHNVITGRICHDVSELPLKMTSKEHLKNLRVQYEELSNAIHKRILPRLCKQKEAKTLLIDSLSLIKRFHTDVLVDALRTGGFENEKFAQLANIAYRGVRNRKTQNLLGKRAAQNVDRMDNLDEQIDSVVQTVNFSSDLFSDVGEYGQCMFSNMDYKEALQNGDCMCLGIEIQRPEAAIADPSRIIVKRISTTLITAESLLNAVLYGLRPEATVNATDIHGGFELGESGTVITGQSREIINGGLPLFINEDHWKVARLRQRPLYGWMATLDVLGFSSEQVITIPFLVLKKVRRSSSGSEFHRRVENWVMQTCIRIFEESHTLHERLFGNEGKNRKSEHLRYLQDPEARLPNSVPSNEVFCLYIHVAAVLPINPLRLTEEETSLLGKYIIVEEWRRRLREKFSSMSSTELEDAIGTLVGLSTPLHLNFLTERLVNILEENVQASFEECWCQLTLPMWSPSLMNCPEKEWRLFDSLCGSFSETLGRIPSFSQEQKMAIYTLHMEYPRSSDIRNCKMYGRKLALSLSGAEKVLSKRFGRSIRAKLQAGYTRAMQDAQMFLEKREIQKFLEVERLDEAARMLGDRLYIGRNVGYYANALGGVSFADGQMIDCIVRCPLEKICMLLNGAHSGKDLYLDKDSKKRKAAFDGLSWKPRKVVVRRWFKRYAIDTTDDTVLRTSGVENAVRSKWKKAFPWRAREIDIWSYERTEGGSVSKEED